MTETDPTNSDPEPTEVSDPDAYINHRRLKSIFDIRDDMREARRRVKLADHDPDLTAYQTLSAYRAIVDSYVVETEPLLRSYEGGAKLLEEKEFGTVAVEPTVIEKEAPGHTSAKETRIRVDGEEYTVTTVPKGETYDLTGLLSVIRQPDPLTANISLNMRMSRGKNRVVTVKRQIGFRTLDLMVRTVNNFLANIGFELDPREEENPLEL